MHPKSPKWLDDIATAGAYIVQFSASSSFADYERNRMMRQAIERNFTIIGEALSRLERIDPQTAGRISRNREVIGFRHRLVHGYDDIDNEQVWTYIQSSLPILLREVEQLLREAEEEFPDQEQSIH